MRHGAFIFFLDHFNDIRNFRIAPCTGILPQLGTVTLRYSTPPSVSFIKWAARSFAYAGDKSEGQAAACGAIVPQAGELTATASSKQIETSI